VAHNFANFKIEDDELRSLLVTNTNYRELDFTPSLVVEIIKHLMPLIKYDESTVCETIYAYVEEFYPTFSLKQLKELEIAYFYLSIQLKSRVPASFGKMMDLAKVKKSYADKDFSKTILDLKGIEITNKNLEVFAFEPEGFVRINFLDQQKSLTLVGVSDNSEEAMIQLREVINKRKYDFFMMGLPSISQFDIYKPKQKGKISIEKYLDQDLIAPSQRKSSGKHWQLDLFEKYGELPIMEGILLDWYKENILCNEKLYQTNELERKVYREEYGQLKPDIMNTILYSLSMKEDKNFKVLLSDIDAFDEISLISKRMDLETANKNFDYARQLWLQEQIYWGIKVNQRGCLMCSNYKELPRNIMGLLPKARYNHSIREKFIAKQITNAIQGYSEHKSFIGFYPRHLLYGILKNLNENFEESTSIVKKGTRTKEQDEGLFQSFISKENTGLKSSNENLKKEFNEKVSMLYYLMNQTERKM